MAFQIVGTAFANATTITIPAHQAGDVIVIHSWRNDSATPPTRPAGFFELISGASGTYSHRVGQTTAVDGSTTSGTWTNATRLACVVIRDATIDEAIVDSAGSSSSDDFYWGPGTGSPFPSARRVVLIGENNATYTGSAAHTVPSGYSLVNSVNNQGSVIHLSDANVTVVDAFVSLTSSGGTPAYRTLTLPLIVNDITGTMAATETGSDTFAGSGDVIVEGTLAATDSGSDVLAASGTVISGRSGSMTALETLVDTMTTVGTVLVTGTFIVSETGIDTFAATGALVNLATGTLAAQEAGLDAFLASGFLSVIDELPAAPGSFRFLLEDNSNILLETADQMLLETQNTLPIMITYENVVPVDARSRTVYVRPGSPI
jgi:hypothetical protein